MPRSFEEERGFLERLSPVSWKIHKGFVPNMNVEGIFYVNNFLERLMMDELRQHSRAQGFGGFLPAVKQIGNVAALPALWGRVSACPMYTAAMDSPLVCLFVDQWTALLF